MKPFASCCTRTPALRYRTRPSPAIAAKCWMRPGRRSRAVQRRRQRNRPHLRPPNHQHNHILVTGDLVDRTSQIQKIFSASGQMSPIAATRERLQSNPPILKCKSFGVQRPRPTRVAHPCNARSSRTTLEKTQSRSLPSVIGSVALARGFTHTVPPTACRFPPPMPDRSRCKYNESIVRPNRVIVRFAVREVWRESSGSLPESSNDESSDNRPIAFSGGLVGAYYVRGKFNRRVC